MTRTCCLRLSTALLVCTLPALAQSPAITEYANGITTNGSPTGIALGADGAAWFTEPQAHRIGRIIPSGGVIEYSVSGAPFAIAVGSDGAMWFTESQENLIGRITVGGAFAEYAVPTPDGYPLGITLGPDGAMWFAEGRGNQIGRITTAGTITEFSAGLTPGAGPYGIAWGPDNTLWFTERAANQIGQITVAGIVKEYPIPAVASQPLDITAAPDGGLWFTESAGNQIGHITLIFEIGVPMQISMQEYPLPTANSGPAGIVPGPDGALWFTETSGHQIARITTAGAVTEFPTPSPASAPTGIAVGPDGALWFTESAAGRVGQAVPAIAPPSFVPYPVRMNRIVSPLYMALGPDAALWFSTAATIGRLTTTGGLVEYLISGSSPTAIALGPDGALWFTEPSTNVVGRISTAGVYTAYFISQLSSPCAITTGPDGAMWIAECTGSAVARVTTAGVVTAFPLPAPHGNSSSIVEAPDGALWFIEASNRIGRLTTTGSFTSYPIPTANSSSSSMALGPDGALWFTEFSKAKIGRITTEGVITEYLLPGALPEGITSGPDGALWFTETGKIGRIAMDGTITEYAVEENGVLGMTPGPDGALWFPQFNSGNIVRVSMPGGPPQNTVKIVATNPPGLTVTVDGVNYPSPHTFTWPIGSLHTLAVQAPPEAAGTRYRFAGWSDGQPMNHPISAGPTPLLYTANLNVEYQLTTAAAAGGSITATPSSADGYYAADATVQLSAKANPGYVFAGWLGVPGTANPLALTVTGAVNATAVFTAASCIFALDSSVASAGTVRSTGSVSVIAMDGCSWVASSPVDWITITSEATGAGSGLVTYEIAASPNGSPRTAVLSIGGQSFTVIQNLGAAVSPAAGSGQTQTFTFRFADPAGWQHLGVVNALINQSLDVRQACYLAYDPPSNTLYLANDAGAGTPGREVSGFFSLDNGQCSVRGAESSVVASGNVLTLTLSVSFSAKFAGNKTLYLAARDQDGNNSGWQALGTWRVP